MATPTAATNGLTSPPTTLDATTTSTNKRKRSESEPAESSDGATLGDKQDSLQHSSDHKQLCEDMLEVLGRHDPTPSVLNYDLHDAQQQSSSSEPSHKRAKLADSSLTTIASKLKEGAYVHLSSLEQDTATVCDARLAPIRAQEQPVNAMFLPGLSSAETIVRSNVLSFKRRVEDLVSRESRRTTRAANSGVSAKGSVPGPGVKGELGSSNAANVREGKPVLSLFGQAGGHKQLFSSLQLANGTQTPLQELGLPNLITVTKVLPSRSEETLANKKRTPTFGDLFIPPATLPQLETPKASKHTQSRSTNVAWLPFESSSKTNRKGNYTTQSLTVGSWLSYGGANASQEQPFSAAAKRKQRDRTLSTGESSLPPTSVSLAETQLQAKEEALFRTAYSSFAPTCDDSKALIPQELKSQIWWNRVGEHRFEEHFAIDPALLESTIADAPMEVADDEILKEAIDNFEPGSADFLSKDSLHDELHITETLRQISELLETLSSFQRMRNTVLPSGSRTPIVPNAQHAMFAGTPTTPTEAESKTYRTLKAQIVSLLLTLPPYAVVKLDGEQLAPLRVSTSMLLEQEDVRGTMEEDQVTRIAKAAAMSAAAGTASAARPPSSASHTKYSATPVARTTALASSYYGQPAAASRTPASAFNRPVVASAPTYNASASAPRPTYGQMPTYSQQSPRPQQSHGQTNGQYYQPRLPLSTYDHISLYQNSSSQQQSNTRPTYAPAPAQAILSQSRAQNAVSYQTNQNTSSQSPYMRSATPAKPPTSYAGYPTTTQSTYQQPQPRPAYTPTPNGVPQAGYGPQTQKQPSSGRATPTYPLQPQTPSNMGLNGFHSGTTSEQQQILLDRQRAQVSLQPQARVAAQISTSGPLQPQSQPQPQPQPQINGVNGGQNNQTPTPQTQPAPPAPVVA
ncbi:hypothetical protein LTR50_002232 [Elasticomyces elasticus]|nr:hypothetical protein LTR50_002232 [Elasticomyces elasticus]